MKKNIFLFLGLLLSIVIVFCPNPLEKNKIVNISIDDVQESLMDLTNEGYTSIFQQPFFSYLKSYHDRYGCCFTLYIQGDIKFNTQQYKHEFQNNSNWLKFGFHSIKSNFNKSEASDIRSFRSAFIKVDSLIGIFAGENSKSMTLRLHYYYATSSEIVFLKSRGIRRLLSADNDRISYSLPKDINSYLIKYNTISYKGMNYRRTNLRLEKMFFPPYKLRTTPNDTIVFFTHESQLKKKMSRLKMGYCLWFLKNSNSKFKFI